MSGLPFDLSGQIMAQAVRDAVRKENAKTISDEMEAERLDFDERTVRLKALRMARDAKFKAEQPARLVRLRPRLQGS